MTNDTSTAEISAILRREIQQEQKKKDRKKRLILLLVFLLFLLMGGLTLYHYLESRDADRIQKEIDAAVGILPGMNDEEIQDRLNRSVAEGRLNISINPTPEYENGTAAGDIRIENIQGNKYSFAVTVTCIGASEDAGAGEYVGEVVMQTGLIDPGSYVQDKRLDVDLPKGQYTCVATFVAYDTVTNTETGEEEHEQVGSAGTQILLTVKE